MKTNPTKHPPVGPNSKSQLWFWNIFASPVFISGTTWNPEVPLSDGSEKPSQPAPNSSNPLKNPSGRLFVCSSTMGRLQMLLSAQSWAACLTPPCQPSRARLYQCNCEHKSHCLICKFPWSVLQRSTMKALIVTSNLPCDTQPCTALKENI